MKSLFSLLLLFMWTSAVNGQVQAEVLQLLSQKDYARFTHILDSTDRMDPHLSRHWSVNRDLEGDFKERVLYITQTVPDSKNAAISSVYSFRVRMVTNGRQFTVYEFAEHKKKNVKKEWISYYDSISFYKNDSLYTLLLDSFRKSYGTDLDENELFIDDFAFGESCGYIGEDPEGKLNTDDLVILKDKNLLMKQLRSTNFEKQVYALDGLSQLRETGITFTPEELALVHHVLSKRGTIYHCKGCEYKWEDVKRVSYKFQFD